MSQLTEGTGISDAPEWFSQTCEARIKTYTTMGTNTPVKRRLEREQSDKPEIWLDLYRSAEEAEAHSVTTDPAIWVWDGEPAIERSLGESMREARKDGLAGVRMMGYENGQWVTLREWPAGVPLSGDEL